MRAHQIMTRSVVTVSPEATILDAANTMLRSHVSGLPVVDAAGKLVGVVSEGDFIRRSEIGTQRKRGRWLKFLLGASVAATDYVHEHGRRVAYVMTADPVTIAEDFDHGRASNAPHRAWPCTRDTSSLPASCGRRQDRCTSRPRLEDRRSRSSRNRSLVAVSGSLDRSEGSG